MNNLRKIIRFMEDNKDNFEVALFVGHMSDKFICLLYYDVGFVSRKTAEQIINHFGLISLPAYRMRKNLGAAGTIYVHPENLNKY